MEGTNAAGFYISNLEYGGIKYYYIHFNTGCDGNLVLDESIAERVFISVSEYKKIAFSFNGIYIMNCVVFRNYSDIKDFANYLNETYLVMLKLQGEV